MIDYKSMIQLLKIICSKDNDVYVIYMMMWWRWWFDEWRIFFDDKLWDI